ncbi:hypothetical protein E2C01_063901 [Portunus trituberculatus]|uniref:Uncharacterized protein n=1 Tax=Portunus trituberculatus TaxID=210409 RepID=A0A5B7HAE1_PORTR|nr:hypothetical protein [Portunus trituberculatus]
MNCQGANCSIECIHQTYCNKRPDMEMPTESVAQEVSGFLPQTFNSLPKCSRGQSLTPRIHYHHYHRRHPLLRLPLLPPAPPPSPLALRNRLRALLRLLPRLNLSNAKRVRLTLI